MTETERRQFLSVTPDMDDVTAQCAIMDLSNYLSRYLKKKVIILLDEYDTPLQEGYMYGYWDPFTAFIRSLFESGKCGIPGASSRTLVSPQHHKSGNHEYVFRNVPGVVQQF